MVPISGSAYAYSYATLGEFIAWFVGWNLVLEYMMSCSVVAVSWSRYFVKLLDHYGINFLPASLTSAPFDSSGLDFSVQPTGAYINLPAIIIVGACTALCYKGIKESAVANTIIVASKKVDPTRQDVQTVDRLIAERVKDPLEYWDGSTHQHAFGLPKFIRNAIAKQTRVVTDANPLIVA